MAPQQPSARSASYNHPPQCQSIATVLIIIIIIVNVIRICFLTAMAIQQPSARSASYSAQHHGTVTYMHLSHSLLIIIHIM